MWYASFIQFGKIDTDTTGQKWLVVFLYAFLRKEEVRMNSGYMIKIYFRDGKTEEHYCDSYKKEKGLLTYYVRFGVNSGEHNVPYDLIDRFIITR